MKINSKYFYVLVDETVEEALSYNEFFPTIKAVRNACRFSNRHYSIYEVKRCVKKVSPKKRVKK